MSRQQPKQFLPAWQWGMDGEGKWRILDVNSAADADLWMAYALIEAARVWNVPRYHEDALQLLKLIKEREVTELPGFGSVLMPAPIGFAKPGSFRLNPSYWPLPVIRRLASVDPSGPWTALARNASKLTLAASPHGLAPDWFSYQKDKAGQFVVAPDGETGAIGSYDAIRVYLWLGITSDEDPEFYTLDKAVNGLRPLLDLLHLPERVDTGTATRYGHAPPGFYAALLPYAIRFASGKTAEHWLGLVKEQYQLGLANDRQKIKQPVYYDQVLTLFGLGWAEQRYKFMKDGKVKLRWETAC